MAVIRTNLPRRGQWRCRVATRFAPLRFAPIRFTPERPKISALPNRAEAGRTLFVQQKSVRITITRLSEVESSSGPKPRALSSCRCCHNS